jgi:regulator of RNase E activity RraB
MGLRSKTDEFINSLQKVNIHPHTLYFSEHHMEEQDLLHLTLPECIRGIRVQFLVSKSTEGRHVYFCS